MADPTAEFRPLPKGQGLAATYLDGIRAGRIVLQKCGGCARHWHYPRPVCPGCGSDDWAWTNAAGTGTVHSFTIVHRAPTPTLRPLTPYVLAMIDLDEGARVTSMIIGDGAADIAVGDPVKVSFPTGPDGDPGMPVYRRVRA